MTQRKDPDDTRHGEVSGSSVIHRHPSVLHVISLWMTERKGSDDTGHGQVSESSVIHRHISVDYKIVSVFARTGHHGQYEGHKGSF